MHNKVSYSLTSGLLALIYIDTQLAYVHRSKPIPLPDNNECRGWAYVGSANLSESAWCVYSYISDILAYLNCTNTNQGPSYQGTQNQSVQNELPQLGMWRDRPGRQQEH
jgi:hypothetical protein